jgi:hypothetical protein
MNAVKSNFLLKPFKSLMSLFGLDAALGKGKYGLNAESSKRESYMNKNSLEQVNRIQSETFVRVVDGLNLCSTSMEIRVKILLEVANAFNQADAVNWEALSKALWSLNFDDFDYSDFEPDEVFSLGSLKLLGDKINSARLNPSVPWVVGKCVDCGASFELSYGQAQWFKTNGLYLPKRCEPCREAKRLRNAENEGIDNGSNLSANGD